MIHSYSLVLNESFWRTFVPRLVVCGSKMAESQNPKWLLIGFDRFKSIDFRRTFCPDLSVTQSCLVLAESQNQKLTLGRVRCSKSRDLHERKREKTIKNNKSGLLSAQSCCEIKMAESQNQKLYLIGFDHLKSKDMRQREKQSCFR